MKKELDYYKIEEFEGGDQNWFKDRWMNIGGCGAITALDSCIYFDRLLKKKHLCPIDPFKISKDDFIDFGMHMKPYLPPRISGIDKLSTYIKEFDIYLKEKNFNLIMEEYPGTRDVNEAKEVVINQINQDYIIPYLNLRHKDKTIIDYEWHWFNISGYEKKEDAFLVKVTSYGRSIWMDFENLWDTGNLKKGGMILYKI